MSRGEHLKNLTTEQRQELIKQAQEARREKAKEAANYKQDFADERLWRKMASRAGVRMAPASAGPGEVKYFNRTLKAIGRDKDWLYSCYGIKKMKDLAELNPTWPAWALQGTILEHHFDELGVQFKEEKEDES